MTSSSSAMVADYSTQAVGAGAGGGEGGVQPGGHLQPGQGEAHPGADLAGEGKVVPEPLEVDAEGIR